MSRVMRLPPEVQWKSFTALLITIRHANPNINESRNAQNFLHITNYSLNTALAEARML